MTGQRLSRLNVRLTARECKQLANRAAECKLSVSAYVRHRCLNDYEGPSIVVDPQVLHDLYRDQRRIGGLLNQLLRHANSRHQDFPELVEQAQTALTELSVSNTAIVDFIAAITKHL